MRKAMIESNQAMNVWTNEELRTNYSNVWTFECLNVWMFESFESINEWTDERIKWFENERLKWYESMDKCMNQWNGCMDVYLSKI